jgi:hypothetical protein
MCYKSPEPRCSGHTGTRLISLNGRRAEVETQMKKVSQEIARILDEKEGSPSHLARKQKRIEKLTVANTKNYEKLVAIDADIRATQRDYDGTPKGQKELTAVIEDPTSTTVTVKDAKRRIRQGAVMRSWRMNQKNRNDGKTVTYTSKTDEKNHKIFLNDPKMIKAISQARQKRKIA